MFLCRNLLVRGNKCSVKEWRGQRRGGQKLAGINADGVVSRQACRSCVCFCAFLNACACMCVCVCIYHGQQKENASLPTSHQLSPHQANRDVNAFPET